MNTSSASQDLHMAECLKHVNEHQFQKAKSKSLHSGLFLDLLFMSESNEGILGERLLMI